MKTIVETHGGIDESDSRCAGSVEMIDGDVRQTTPLYTMKILLILAGLLVSQLFADPVKVENFTANSTGYVNPTVEKISEMEVKVVHSSGVSRIPIRELPAEIQALVGYDPAKTKTAEEAINAARIEQNKRAELAAKSVGFSGIVVDVDENGILAEHRGFYKTTKAYTIPASVSGGGSNGLGGVSHRPAEKVTPDPALVGRPEAGIDGEVFLVGYPNASSVTNRQLVDVDAIEDGTYTYFDKRYRKFKVLKAYPKK